MYGQQQQSPKPTGSDVYDQQQLLRTQSQSSNSQYGLNNKASIASTSSTSNQAYGQQVARGQGQTMSMQQSIGNSSGGGGFSAANYQ